MGLKVQVVLDENQVKEAIGMYLKANGFNTTKVEYKMSIRSYGYGRNEHEEKVFSGATCTVEPLNQEVRFSSLAAQIASVEGEKGPW